MRRNRLIAIKWFFPVLFTLYVCGITLFTHTHIVDNLTIVHSHPYKVTDKPSHEHTEKEIQLLDQIFHTSITGDIIPVIDCSGDLISENVSYPDLYKQGHLIRTDAPLQLRAPPFTV